DANIRIVSKEKAKIRFGHGKKQKEYIEWKKNMFGCLANKLSKRRDGKAFTFDVMANRFAFDLHDHIYDKSGKRTVSAEYLEKLNKKSLAVWYMDDGTFSGSSERWGNGKAYICNKSLSKEDKEKVIERLAEMGISGVKD